MTNATTLSVRVGVLQASGLEIYVTDPAHDEPFPAVVDGSRLRFETADRDTVFWRLADAANSADGDKDAELRDALQRLASAVLRA